RSLGERAIRCVIPSKASRPPLKVNSQSNRLIRVETAASALPFSVRGLSASGALNQSCAAQKEQDRASNRRKASHDPSESRLCGSQATQSWYRSWPESASNVARAFTAEIKQYSRMAEVKAPSRCAVVRRLKPKRELLPGIDPLVLVTCRIQVFMPSKIPRLYPHRFIVQLDHRWVVPNAQGLKISMKHNRVGIMASQTEFARRSRARIGRVVRNPDANLLLIKLP